MVVLVCRLCASPLLQQQCPHCYILLSEEMVLNLLLSFIALSFLFPTPFWAISCAKRHFSLLQATPLPAPGTSCYSKQDCDSWKGLGWARWGVRHAGCWPSSVLSTWGFNTGSFIALGFCSCCSAIKFCTALFYLAWKYSRMWKGSTNCARDRCLEGFQKCY